ncbi:MAG: hypothetical protein K2K57_11875 [Oscillospiraceae bacterium]|nr:hypothetical protein [Oscillospiraceae bacterium]
MNVTIVNAADSNVFRSLKEITANKPTFEVDLDMIKNAPAFTGVTQVNVAPPVLAANNRDTFEKSAEDELTVDTEEVMDYESSLDFKISAGMTREQLATHFGDLGKKLDEEYAAGKYTEDEYNDLNSELMESYDNAITRCERRAAAAEVDKAEMLQKQAETMEVNTRRRRGWSNIEKILAGMGVEIKDSFENCRERETLDMGELGQIIHELTESLKNGPDEDYTGEKMTPEQQRNEDIKAMIARRERLTDEFVAENINTDRDAMVSMMNTVRQGGELLGGRDEIYGEKQAQTWFVEGYTPLPNDLVEYMKLNPYM